MIYIDLCLFYEEFDCLKAEAFNGIIQRSLPVRINMIAVSSINEGKIFTNLEMALSRRIEHGSLTVSINMIDLASEFVQ